MEVRNDRVKKLTDDILEEVAGGFETKPPLKTSVITDSNVPQNKKTEDKEGHSIVPQ